MKKSVVVTVLNEDRSVSSLLNSLLFQKDKPDEIILVDGGSTDKTLEIVRHFQKKNKRIKVIKGKYSRSEGRNIGVEAARHEIIAMIDAGCIAQDTWLARLTEPFSEAKVDIVAGFYEMTAKNAFGKATSVFLGTTPDKFDVSFLPSTRSIAFRSEIWERVEGFSEKLTDTAEDTVFIAEAIKQKAKIARVKNAKVEWRIPESPKEVFKKIKAYAKGDFLSGIWIHPAKGTTSHNVKASLIFARYFVGLYLLIAGFDYSLFWLILVAGLIFYAFYAYRKVFEVFQERKVALWGIYIQFLGDFAVMTGFIEGIFQKKRAKETLRHI